MPSPHVTVRIVTSEQSIVAKAAFLSATALYDEQLDGVVDCRAKAGVDHTEILAPDDAPEWALDREQLWNCVARREVYPRVQYALDIQLALPVTLARDAHIALARAFARDHFVAKGLLADFTLHQGLDGRRHAHLLVPLRSIDAGGFTTHRPICEHAPQVRGLWAKAVQIALAGKDATAA